MASIQKRNNKWQVRISYKDSDGKFRTKNKSGFKTKKEAQIYVSEFEVNPNNSKFESKSSQLFYDYFWNWFETYKESNVTERTKKTYIQVHNNLIKYLPNTHLDEINREIYQKALIKYGKNHSKSTMIKFNSLVHACVEDAIYDGKIEKDFVKRTSITFNKNNNREIEYLNIKEINTLTKYLIQNRNKHFTSKYMILLALYSGMRLGEIQGLMWKDINFNFKTISIRRTWNSEENKYQPTKNESSNRIIRVTDYILSIIKELKNNANDPVFINQYGTIPTSSAVNKTLRESLKNLNINRYGFHFHSLRHTHVAYLLSKRIDIYIISKRLGHSDVGTTTRVYSYLIDEYRQQSNDEIENALNELNTNKKRDTKIN